jgi:hypothetical protein
MNCGTRPDSRISSPLQVSGGTSQITYRAIDVTVAVDSGRSTTLTAGLTILSNLINRGRVRQNRYPAGS